MGFEWDPDKAQENFRKHAVQFSTEVQAVFSDDLAITVMDESDMDEQRFVTLGLGGKARLLVVVFCYRGDNIRIISARPAGKSESEDYEVQP